MRQKQKAILKMLPYSLLILGLLTIGMIYETKLTLATLLILCGIILVFISVGLFITGLLEFKEAEE